MAQNPHRYQCRARCRGRGPGWGTGGWRKPGNCTHGRCHDETNLAQHEPRGPTSGTKLSQHAPSHRMCGTKLSLHARPRRISGIKLSLLTRNGSIWRFFDMQGEFCTVLTTKKPSRENFVPNARQRWGSPTQQDTRPHLCGGRRRDRRVREDSRRRAKSHINDLAPLVWRTSESPEGPAAAPVDNGARPQYPQTTATPRPDKFRMQFPHDTD